MGDPIMASRSSLSQNIYNRHLSLVSEIRDMFIFVQQAVATLVEAKSKYNLADRRGGRDKRYYVPVAGKTKFAQRRDAELIAIYDRYTSRGLYETFLVSGVSIFETFLADVMRLVFLTYPRSVMQKFPSVPSSTTLPVEVVFDKNSKEAIIEEVIRRHLGAVFYSRPDAYIGYFCELVGADGSDRAFADFIEIKATRDLLVHGEAVVNQIYLDKSGSRARGALGQSVSVDESYFSHFVRTVTRISGIVERDSNKKFPAS